MMWPFTRKSKTDQPTEAPELPEKVETLSRRRERSKSDRSHTVAAFVRRMQELEGGYDGEHERRNGHAD